WHVHLSLLGCAVIGQPWRPDPLVSHCLLGLSTPRDAYRTRPLSLCECRIRSREEIGMPTTLGSIRRLLLTPSFATVTFGKRGFPVTQSATTEHLEAIPHAVLCGFEWGIDTRGGQWELERRLAMVRPEVLGFAYEGATMACTVLDAMRGG